LFLRRAISRIGGEYAIKAIDDYIEKNNSNKEKAAAVSEAKKQLLKIKNSK